MTHRHMTPMQAERTEEDRRHLLRKTTAQANERMLRQTARQQLAAAMRELERGPDDAVPDANNNS